MTHGNAVWKHNSRKCEACSFSSGGWGWTFLYVGTVASFTCLCCPFQTFLCLCRISFLFAPSVSRPPSDSCKPQSARLCLKVICVRCISGCQLDKALRIIKNNNCLQGQIRPAGALWRSMSLLFRTAFPLQTWMDTYSEICGSAFTYSIIRQSLLRWAGQLIHYWVQNKGKMLIMMRLFHIFPWQINYLSAVFRKCSQFFQKLTC